MFFGRMGHRCFSGDESISRWEMGRLFRNRLSQTLLFLTAALLSMTRARAQDWRTLPACQTSQMSVATDAENGSFNGMSHGGTLVVLRNLGPAACSLPQLLKITILDKNGHDLQVKATYPGGRGMHPGPVLLPLTIAAGAEATATLRWVSGPVFDHSVCVTAARMSVEMGDTKLQAAIAGTMCGNGPDEIHMEQSRFALDPVYHPAANP